MVAEDDDEASKTEEPSERKISKAKEEGDVAISQEAKSFIMLLGMLFVVWLILPLMGKWFYLSFIQYIERPESIPTDSGHIQLMLWKNFLNLMKILGIPFALFMVLGIAASIMQTGFVYAPKKLMPDMDPITILVLIHEIVVLLIFTILLAVLVMAIADFAYQKYAHLKKLRMTKQEVKDEYKEMEGDPLIKSRIRQIRNERARHRMMDNVPKADVVIVNPTHYAVALQYDMDKMDAPIVVAKGLDNIALKIREIAEEHEIPIVENPPLARALFASVELDEMIPQEHFKAVAEVIGYVMQLKNETPR